MCCNYPVTSGILSLFCCFLFPFIFFPGYAFNVCVVGVGVNFLRERGGALLGHFNLDFIILNTQFFMGLCQSRIRCTGQVNSAQILCEEVEL